MDMNRMTVKLQEALQSASALAMRRGHQGIDVEHLLLALMEQEGGIAGSLLEQAGVSPAAVRQAAEQALTKVAQVHGPGAAPGSRRYGTRSGAGMVWPAAGNVSVPSYLPWNRGRR